MKPGLTEEQEMRRIQGLRILARIIRRHYLAHPELYPAPTAKDEQKGRVSSSWPAGGEASREEGAA